MRADCEEIREITAELALGIAGGEDRARALEHMAHCRDCRRELEQLTHVVDDLLVVAPEEDPPAGFEERVLASITPKPKPARKPFRLRVLRPLAAVAAGAAIAAAALVFAYHDDHKLASEYRQALAAADGSQFVATPLRDAAGVKRGSVSLYDGKPSWLIVAVLPHEGAAPASAELVTRAGEHLRLTGFQLRKGVWGGPLPVPLPQVASVQLLDSQGHSALVAFMNKHW